jgi:hypothetical protein
MRAVFVKRYFIKGLSRQIYLFAPQVLLKNKWKNQYKHHEMEAIQISNLMKNVS